MRVAIVLNTSWNIYNFRKGLIKAFLKRGHEVIAIAPKDKYSNYLIEMGCDYYSIKLQNKGTNPIKDIGYMYQLYRIYKTTKPDVILNYTIKPNIYSSIVACICRILVINNVSGLGTVFLRNNLSSKVAKLLYKFAFRFPKRVFFQNQDDLNLFLQTNLIKKKQTGLVPGSGIPLDQFKPLPFIRNSHFTFLMIARLLYDKGIIEYVKAAQELKDQGINARFQLLGFLDENKKLGVSQKQLNKWIESEVIEYLGTSDNVGEVISKVDVVVLPSYREGTPRSLLEASSMAKPIIATDIAGCKETIDDEINGLLCKVKDFEDLALKMKKLYDLDNVALKAMGEAGRKKMEEEFDEEIVITRYLSIIEAYEKMLHRKKQKTKASQLQHI